jgi:hypothetical protein
VVQNREVVALGEDTAQACREGKEAGERCAATQGWCSPFIGDGGAPGRKCRRVTAGDLRPTPLMAGEGVNGASRGGIKTGGVRGFDWRHNDGGREARGDQLRRGAGEACFGSTDAGEMTKLTGGARVAVTEEEGVIAGLRKLEEEAAFGKYAKAAQARMGRACARGSLRCRAGQHGRGWAGWAEF